jgi:putative transposase
VPHDTRDAVVDYVRDWSCKSDIPVSLLLRWVGITASKYHDWRTRFGKVNEHNASIPRDHWLTDDEKARIHTFARAHPLEGYRRLTFLMLDADVVACSPTSVYRVLKAANLLAGSSPIPSKKGTGFVQPLEAHEHWHIDVSYLNIAGTFYFLCSVLDGYSRVIVHHEIREKMEESDVEVILQRAREAQPGVTPRIISDNGPQFLAKDFKEFVRVAGMTHVKTSPYYPQSDGKIERWHKTLKGESIRVSVPLSLEDARRIVADYVTHYDTVRLHSAIGYITPKDKIEGRDEVIFATRDRKLAEARERRAQLRSSNITDGGDECQRVVTDSSAECQCVATVRPAIDFAAVKSLIGIVAVLKLLGVEMTKVQHRGCRPLHGSTSGTSRCFSANGQKNVFQCFKCGHSGNALDLWSKATQQTPYDAALDLCARLGIEPPTLNQETGTGKRNP